MIKDYLSSYLDLLALERVRLEDYLLLIDESHATIPQVRAMYNGDKSRKDSLVNYGFRLPSAYDNRPLKFEEFEEKIKEGKFLEHAEFVGNYYGTPLDKVNEQLNLGKEVILEIEVEGAAQVREKCKDAVFIFLAPPSKAALYKRLKRRGTESEEVIKERIDKANREFKLAFKYDYIVINDEVRNAADRIMAIIRAEHAKTERSIHKYLELIENETDCNN